MTARALRARMGIENLRHKLVPILPAPEIH